jgi:hypothetical protein
MKTMNITKIYRVTLHTVVLLVSGFFTACEDRDYPAGLPEFEHHYYIVYVPNNNSSVTVKRSRTELLELPVQFYSEFSRDYDAVAAYEINTDGIANPAVRGQDFEIVDEDGRALTTADGKYRLVFPKAEKAQARIFVKLLNNAAPGTRAFELNLIDNIEASFRVDVFSTAYKRTIQID